MELSESVANIHCILRRTEDDEVVKLLELSDVVLLPYRQITNSGSALLALSAKSPAALSMKPFAWPDIARQTLGFYTPLNPGASNVSSDRHRRA